MRMNRIADHDHGRQVEQLNDCQYVETWNASEMAAVESSAVSFCRPMKSFSSGGMTRRIACGTSTVRRVCA